MKEKKKKKNILENKFVFKLACVLGFGIIKSLFGTLKIHEFNKDDFNVLNKDGGLCFLWHRTLMTGIYANQNRNISTLAALSPDGSVQVYLCEKFGYKCYRGSTKRHGVQGLFQIMKGLKRGEFVAITVDGPIGPAEKCQPGAAAMIKRTGLPFVAIGVAIDKKWVFEKSWDKHTLPKPNANVVVYYSDAVKLDINSDDEVILSEIENKIKEASEKAEEILKEKFI